MGLLDALIDGYKRGAGLLAPTQADVNLRASMPGLIADFTPVIGDAKSVYDGVQSARQGDYIGAGLGALGALPFVPSFGSMIKPIYHSTTKEAAEQIAKNGFDVRRSADGTIWFTTDPKAREVAASGKGAIIKRNLDDKKLKLGGWDEADKYGVDELISQGYDGLKLDDWYQIFHPEKLTK